MGRIVSPNGTCSSKYDQDSNQKESDMRRTSNPQNNILQDIIFDKKLRDNDFHNAQSTKQDERRLSREAERRSSLSKYSTHVSGQVSTKNQTKSNLAHGHDHDIIPLQIPTEDQSLYNDPLLERQQQLAQQNIGSDLKPIAVQGTNEKESSRPLSSLYVDDADEDEDDEQAPHYSDHRISPHREMPRRIGHSGHLSPDESDTTFNPDQLMNGFMLGQDDQSQGQQDCAEQPFQKISVEEAINSKACHLRMRHAQQHSGDHEDDQLIGTMTRNQMQEDCCNPRVDMETGEVYS